MTKKIEHIYEDEVEKKRCCTCKIYQPLENYNSCKGSWDKLRPKCKKCLHLVRMKNKERMTNYNKKYWQKTQESQKIKHKKWRENNVEHRKEYNKKWRMKNGEACDKREWQKRKNDPIHKEKQKRYRIERCKTDPGYKLGFDVRCRIRQALKSIGQGKTKRTVRYLHCTLQELKEYLEVKFKPGMTWNNHGKWHRVSLGAALPLSTTDDLVRRLTSLKKKISRCVFIILIYNLCGVQRIYEKGLNLTQRRLIMNGVEKNGREFLFKGVFIFPYY